MERHEVPTHLIVRDKAVFGLTARQLFLLGSGLVASYSLWPDIRLGHVTLIAQLISVTLLMGCAVVSAFVVIARQPVEAWVSHWVLYVSQSRCLVWRPIPHDIPDIPESEGEDDDEEAENQEPPTAPITGQYAAGH